MAESDGQEQEGVSKLAKAEKEVEAEEVVADEDFPEVELLSDVKVPRIFYQRMTFKVQVIDEMFGGPELPGIMPGTSYLFTGDPGAGKSTVALQFADMLASQGKSVLYAAGEESKFMIKHRADRLGLKGRFAIAPFRDLERLVRYIENYGVEVVFVDSIQELGYGDYEGRELLEKIIKVLAQYGHDNFVTMFLIGQVTKAGVFAGPNAIKHNTDAHAHVKVSKETGHRVFELQKNRMGPAGIPYEFFMGAQGIDFKQLPPEEQEKREGMGKSAARRETIKEFIIEKLEAGEYISGYCFERYNQECSGGFWRGMVEKAEKELRAKGVKIGETKRRPQSVKAEDWGGDGRRHIFLVKDEEVTTVVPPEDEEEPIDPEETSEPEEG